jgi:hypothetical protein
MNTNKLIILVAVALAAIGLGIWVSSERASQEETSSASLFPDLKKTINDATAVRIFTAGDKQAVEIARKDSAWIVSGRHGFPADDAKVRKLLLSLANAKLREEKTSNPENYASLNVEDVSTEDASGIRVEVAGVQPTVNLIVGKPGTSLDTQYVRKVGEKQSWLVDADFDTTSVPQDWLRKTLFEIAADRIQSATVQAKGAKPYTAAKNAKADADFSVVDLPKAKKLTSPSAANTLATALTGVALSDVQPAAEFEGSPDVTATYQTFDGLVLEMKGWSKDDKRYLAGQVRFDAALADRFTAAGEPAESKEDNTAETAEAATAKTDEADEPGSDKADGAAKPSAAAPAATPNVAEEAKSLNERLAGWVFEIPEYKYNAIFKPLDDLLAD